MTTAESEKYEKDLYEMIVDCDGAEIHKDDWAVAEALEKKDLITLGWARGPNSRVWRRAELVTEAKSWYA